MTLRVGLDARKLHDFGIGTYIQALLGEFVALGVPEQLVAYRRPNDPVPPGLELAAPHAWRAERAAPYSLAELWRLAVRARQDRVALFHAPHYVCPPILPCPAVVTIHDLIHLRFPRRDRPLAPLYARVMLRLAVSRATRLITVSESTRQDLAARLGVPRDRIRVVPNGVAARFHPAADPAILERGVEALGLTRPYLLFVGNPMPHKNLGRVLDALTRLPRTVGPLVIAGARTEARARVARAVATRALADRVIVLPPVPAATMPLLYQAASLLVIPSLWEGFGLPAVEAMASGTPVVASDRGALPEVIGDAGLLVDPTNVDALRDAMYTLAVQPSLRAALRAAGLARARAFSWRHAAEATVVVYREAVTDGVRGAK